jgi:hypothetical protein
MSNTASAPATAATDRPAPPAAERSTMRLARATGALLLVMAASAIFAELGVRAALVVPGDASETAARIAASPELFRFGFVGYLLAFLLDVPVAILLYVTLRSAGRTLALLATSFRLVYAAVVGAALLPYLGAMVSMGGADALSAFDVGQREALVLLCMTGFDYAFHLALVFFGAHLALLGPLLFRSRRVPRVFGVLIGLAGLAYVVDNLLLFLAPDAQAAIAPYVAALAMSEVAFAVWLLAKGMRGDVASSSRRA